MKVAVSMRNDLAGTEGQGGSTIIMVLRVMHALGIRLVPCEPLAAEEQDPLPLVDDEVPDRSPPRGGATGDRPG